MNNRAIRKLVPKQVKRAVKDLLLRRELRDAIDKIRTLPDGQSPSRGVLAQLLAGWGNDGYVAKLDYFEEVARRSANAKGPILECGSGATTILLGLMCSRRKIRVWSLEHSPEWQRRVTEELARHAIEGVEVCISPLIEYGEFVWYDPPLQKMPDKFALAICDGPPGTTKGGRYGLLPVMGSRLPPESTILVDDAGRPGELEMIKRWRSEAGFALDFVDQPDREYAIMTRQ